MTDWLRTEMVFPPDFFLPEFFSESAYYTITTKKAKFFPLLKVSSYSRKIKTSGSRWEEFLTFVQAYGVGQAYFLGSQKSLGPARFRRMQTYAVDEDVVRRYRGQALTFSGNWLSWCS